MKRQSRDVYHSPECHKRVLVCLTSAQNKALKPQPGPATGIHPLFSFTTLLSRSFAAVLLAAFQSLFLPSTACPSRTHSSCLDALSCSFYSHLCGFSHALSVTGKTWELDPGNLPPFSGYSLNSCCSTALLANSTLACQAISFHLFILGHSCLI